MSVCVHACARPSLLLSCCRDRYGGLEQARDPFQTPRELRKGVSAGPKCRISLSFCTPEGRTHTRARPILLGGGGRGVEERGRENRAAKRTVDLPYSYHTLERVGGGSGGSSPVPFRCRGCMWLHQLACLPARPLETPEGQPLRRTSARFSPYPHFFPPLPFFI